MRDCPSAEDLAAFLDGRLTQRERADITEHAADCAACRRVLSGVATTRLKNRGRWFGVAVLLMVLLGDIVSIGSTGQRPIWCPLHHPAQAAAQWRRAQISDPISGICPAEVVIAILACAVLGHCNQASTVATSTSRKGVRIDAEPDYCPIETLLKLILGIHLAGTTGNLL